MIAATAREVAIRPVTEADAALIVGWRGRDDVHCWLFAEERPTIEAHIQWFRSVKEREEFVIVWRGAPVGTCGLANVRVESGSAEYGIMLGEPVARGKGVALRAGRLLLARAFGPLGRSVVWAERFADNYACARHLAGLGFVTVLPAPAPRTKDGVLRKTMRACVWPRPKMHPVVED